MCRGAPPARPYNAGVSRAHRQGLLAAGLVVAAAVLVMAADRPDRTRRWPVDRAALARAVGIVAVSPPQADELPSACDITTSERVVAVGDVHGGYDRFVAILREAGVIDADNRWAAGRAVFVQTGDVVDRGPDSRRAIDLLQRLEGEAERAGGAVHALLGNHEVMRLMRLLHDVSAEEYAAFRTPDSEELRERYFEILVQAERDRAKTEGRRFDERAFRKEFLDAIPLGFVEMQIAFEETGPYGQWLRSNDTMARVNGVVFVHGGISRNVAPRGCDAINAGVRAELRQRLSVSDPGIDATLSAGPNGPLWYRGLALDDSGVTAADVDAVLAALGAEAIVIGHTVAPRLQIRPRFNDRVVQIDTGLLGGKFFPNGRASALEIHNGTFTAIYEGRRQVLFERRPAFAGASGD